MSVPTKAMLLELIRAARMAIAAVEKWVKSYE